MSFVDKLNQESKCQQIYDSINIKVYNDFEYTN